jgi:hypothetical protein
LRAVYAPPAGAGPLKRLFFIFDYTFLSLPKYQRLASVAFFLQSLVSLLLISLFCAVQAVGFDVQFPMIHSLSTLFANSYAASSETTFAGTRFYNLFLPLVSLYVITLTCFAVAVVRSLAPLLRHIGKNGVLLGAIVFFLVGLCVVLFVDGRPTGKGIQRMITEGNALGYVALFVFFPMIWMFLTASLPSEV